MENRTYGYARVSSNSQNLARQIEAFKSLGLDDAYIITDKASGKDTDRDGYKYLKNQLLRSGDTLIVKSLDRLSRCKVDIASELSWYKEHQIRVKVMDIPTTMIDFPDGQEWVLEMVNNILIEVLGTIAEQERKTIKDRQAEGNKQMKKGEDGKRYSLKTGRAVGRPNAEYPSNWKQVYDSWKNGDIKAVEAMEMLNLKKTSFYKLVKQYESK